VCRKTSLFTHSLVKLIAVLAGRCCQSVDDAVTMGNRIISRVSLACNQQQQQQPPPPATQSLQSVERQRSV